MQEEYELTYLNCGDLIITVMNTTLAIMKLKPEKNSPRDQLPVDWIAKLVEHCTGIAEGHGGGGSEPPASRTLLSRFPYLYLPPPAHLHDDPHEDGHFMTYMT